jgi:hypothetical protein
MGHIRVGMLPKYPRWTTVMGVLADTDVPTSTVADKVLEGAKETLVSESAQSSISYCIWLLAQLTIAARGDEFKDDIARLGIQVTDDSKAADFLARTSHVATIHLSSLTPRNALNSIAGLTLREVLTSTIGVYANTLFGTGLPEVQQAFRKYSTQRQFSLLVHTYFTVFLRRVLCFIIDKEITNHLGLGKRFEYIEDIESFESSLEAFASQTSRIVDEFSGGWYSKKVWQQGDISESDVKRFVHIALRKLCADLDLVELDNA